MTFLIVLVLAILGGLMLAGYAGFGLILWGQHAQKRAEAKAPDTLDKLFAGGDDVVFKVNMESMKYETVVLGARQRGYRLVHETNDTQSGSARTLIFERKRAEAP